MTGTATQRRTGLAEADAWLDEYEKRLVATRNQQTAAAWATDRRSELDAVGASGTADSRLLQ